MLATWVAFYSLVKHRERGRYTCELQYEQQEHTHTCIDAEGTHCGKFDGRANKEGKPICKRGHSYGTTTAPKGKLNPVRGWQCWVYALQCADDECAERMRG